MAAALPRRSAARKMLVEDLRAILVEHDVNPYSFGEYELVAERPVCLRPGC
jgi:hypothetical protein